MKNKTVLIAEDSAFDQKMLAAIVSKLGPKTLICADGQEAIVLLKERHAAINLVLLDLAMPVIDGISVLGHCKAHYPDLPVIIITSSEDAEDAVQAAKWGVDGFIHKPVDPDKLGSAIYNALNPSFGKQPSLARNKISK